MKNGDLDETKIPELAHIARDLWPLVKPVAGFELDPDNARRDHDLEGIAASMLKYGQRTPIVVNDGEGGRIVKGNGTFLAATRILGWEFIAAVIVIEDPLTATGYAIADNAAGDKSRFDEARLARLLAGLPEDLPTGIGEAELKRLLDQLPMPPNAAPMPEMPLETAPGAAVEQDPFEPENEDEDPAPGAYAVQYGDLWRLPSVHGRDHFLLVGDPAKDNPRLWQATGRVSFELAYCTPPMLKTADDPIRNEQHRADYTALAHDFIAVARDRATGRGAFITILYDDIDPTAYGGFTDICGIYFMAMRESGPGATWALASNYLLTEPDPIYKLEAYDAIYGDIRPRTLHRHWRQARTWANNTQDRDLGNLWPGSDPGGEDFELLLAVASIRAYTDPGDLVYVPFAGNGNGAGLWACENLARVCAAVCSDPHEAGRVLAAYEKQYEMTPAKL